MEKAARSQFEAVIDEISAALMMEPKAEELRELQRTLAKAADVAKVDQRVVAAIKELQANSSKTSTAESNAQLGSLLSEIQRFLHNPASASFCGEGKHSAQPGEISATVDKELLVEFIEKHSSLLEEFEVSLMSRISGEDQSAVEDYTRGIKGYIHNLKGDAGSIGLTGIERVCHSVEDILTTVAATQMLEPLLAFKEWALGCIKAFASNSSVPQSWQDFFKGFEAAVKENGGGPKKSTECLDASGLPPGANLELLAELMAESTSKPLLTPVSAISQKQSGAASDGAADSYTITGDLEIFAEFAAEAEDHLAAIETTLLEQSDNLDKEAIDKIFRAAHSIKGASSYFMLEETRQTSHVTEDLLDQVRTGKRTMDQGMISLVLSYKDLQQELLRRAKEAIKADMVMQRTPRTARYLEELRAYTDGKSSVNPANAVATVSAPPTDSVITAGASVAPAADAAEKLDIKTFVKVDTKRLDLLIDSIGEMVIYSSMLIQKCRAALADDESTIKTTHQVEKFSRDLQNIGMSMRLIPIRGLFQKMSRLVWDTGKKIGKDIKFEMEGEDTELDRNIIDQLADPLMHMVRNAIDHGVETPDERRATGKSPQGQVRLSASHSGGSIQIRISDDGRGLNPEKLLNKAVEKGIVRPGTQLSLQETYQLIFAAGFSTASVVTDISGRGVGMDVVRRNIEALRGHVHITSEVGKGTTFVIELPLTLAIIDGILVKVASEQYIIPTLSIVELIRASSQQIVHTFDRGETFKFRGKFLPLYRLGNLFDLEKSHKDVSHGIVTVVECSGELVALFVDDVLGSYSTVIKNLSDCFEERDGISGCAIMSNGDVALILDVRTLLSLARRTYVHELQNSAGKAVELAADALVN